MYPLMSTARQLNNAQRYWNAVVRRRLGKKNYGILKRIEKRSQQGQDTEHEYAPHGKLLPSRKRFHEKILRKFLSQNRKSIDPKDPDLYVFGGIAGSGKTEVLRKKVVEPVTTIDSDEFKTRLAEKDKSPLPQYPLIHAMLLHEESDRLTKEAIRKSIKTKRNVILDSTLANLEKNKKIIRKFRRAGYDIHLLGTQKTPHKTYARVVSRFFKKGRYVPLGVIKAKGNQINRSVWKARTERDNGVKMVDTYQIYDTTTRVKTRLVSKSKYGLTHNFRNPKKGKK